MEDFEKPIAEYARSMSHLDQVLEFLTKSECADCSASPVGCCHGTMFHKKYFEKNQLFLDMQEQEAKENGWISPHPDSCRYFVENKGCTLKNFKTPLCAGYLCRSLKDPLKELYPYGATDTFLSRMESLSITEKGNSMKDLEFIAKMIKDTASAGDEIIKIARPGHKKAFKDLRKKYISSIRIYD